jgi:hypothetical protein
MSGRIPYLIYPQQMWRYHLFDDYHDHGSSNLDYSPNDFGPVKTLKINGKNVPVVQLLKNTLLYNVDTGENFILNADNSNKFYVIDETSVRSNIDTRNISLASSYEGEVIGTMFFNDANISPKLLYSFRLCTNYFLMLNDNFTAQRERPFCIKSERSELVSYTRSHYYQLRKIFPSLNSLSIKDLIQMENDARKNKDVTKKLYKLYEYDMNTS